MSHIAFYRKYRPRNFDEVIGQENVIRTLKNAISSNRIGHAYIFSGPKGIGKTSIAKMFGKAINCLSPINGNSCGKCKNCIAIQDGQTFDIHELDAASNNGVEEIRKIIESSKIVPQVLSKKVFIIDEAHMLTNQS
jgi:DNA polymerase-3 subunit gamma/tau